MKPENIKKKVESFGLTVQADMWEGSEYNTVRIEEKIGRYDHSWIADVQEIRGKLIKIDVVGYMLDWELKDYGFENHSEIFHLHANAIRKRIPKEYSIIFSCSDSQFKSIRL
ncbi:MAG: hypothetical protein ACTSVZ_07320 [Promethearchaeota archaeon]